MKVPLKYNNIVFIIRDYSIYIYTLLYSIYKKKPVYKLKRLLKNNRVVLKYLKIPTNVKEKKKAII